ncbi:hypothetical protein ACICHK_07025 [Streptomyces sp. AHU1]|uniref:hypothetical protein n=1 Tax=Streptomyces sp. AHU1 TaxID=3377215 RepID=UPI003877B4FB
MRNRYPIVRHRELRPRCRWDAWRERRSPLIAGTGQVLVHETDGVYGTGPSVPGPAAAVTVVDVHQGARVYVRRLLTAPGGHLEYPVTVLFRCTVVDPVAVVRARRTGGPWDVRRALAGDPRYGNLTRALPEDDENGVREALTALLAPRPVHRDIPGVRVEFERADVEPARQIIDYEA